MSKTTLVLALALLPAAGCSLVYDGGVFVTEDAAPPDAEIPDAGIPDANPSELALEGVEPARLYEGQGCIPDGEGGCTDASRPVPVVISGRNIVPGAQVSLSGAGLDEVEVEPVFSRRFDALAFTLQIPIDEERDATEDLTIAISQGEVSDQITLPVEYLPELAASEAVENGVLSLEGLAPRYSRIVLDDPDPEDQDPGFDLSGTGPARFVATAEIRVAALVRANGRAGEDGTGGDGGPGGCKGGDSGTPGNCEAGGGDTGQGAEGGGGGGGYASSGDPAQKGANGGSATGGPMLTELDYEGNASGNRGNGGGGGGGTGGGGGGGGGGTIELRSFGQLVFEEGGGIQARGGQGAPCRAGVVGIGDTPAGGGGSGGTLLARAPVLDKETTGGTDLDVEGGPGGTQSCESLLSSAAKGGDGALGRIRIDTSAADLPLTTMPSPERGPMIDRALVSLSPEGTVSVEVIGDSTLDYGVRANAAYVDDVGGGQSLMVPLQEGWNEICAVAVADDQLKRDEALNCLTVAYIPQ